MKRILVIMLGCFFSVFLVQGSGGSPLDEQGTGYTYCSPQYGSFQRAFTPPVYKNSYIFKSICNSPGDYTEYKTNGQWDWKSKIAIENISADNLSGMTRSSCPDDPWLNDVQCTNISANGNIFGFGVGKIEVDQLPVSRNLLDQQPSMRQAWRAELEDKIKKTPPRIVAPQQNKTYKFTFKDNLTFRAEAFIPPDDPKYQSWGVWVQFEHLVWPGGGKKQANVVGILPLSNNFAMKTFLIYPGTWRVRARTTSNSHQGDWSSWVTFKITEPKLPWP